MEISLSFAYDQKGLPYKYVVDVDSKGFSEAPKQILEGVRRMTWAGKYIVGDEAFKPFNELLAVGYFEGCKMGVRSKSLPLENTAY